MLSIVPWVREPVQVSVSSSVKWGFIHSSSTYWVPLVNEDMTLSKTDPGHNCHKNHTNQCRTIAEVTQLFAEPLTCFSPIIPWQGEKKWDRNCSRLKESQESQQPNAIHEETSLVSVAPTLKISWKLDQIQAWVLIMLDGIMVLQSYKKITKIFG